MIKDDTDVRVVLTEDDLRVVADQLCRFQTLAFNIADVPENLRALAPYAAIWGVPDDWARESLVDETPEQLRENITFVVRRFDDELDEWLAGPEAAKENPSDAYIAFSSLRMVADYI